MKKTLVFPALIAIALVTSCSNGSDSAATDTPNDPGSTSSERSLDSLLAVAELLPASIEPTEVTSEQDPPRLVMRVGVTFQTMDTIIETIDQAVGPAGFTRSTGTDLAWTNDGGISIEAPGRPTLLTFQFGN